MNNRKRANSIAGGIILIMVVLALIIAAFPIPSALTIICLIATFVLYKLFNLMRNTIEDHLDEEEINSQWKQEKNIK